jgi:ADP-ribosyl-[dinitrogen reductase] hydrolase
VKSLEAALWRFSTTNNYRDGCLAAVNLGDDADTTAAIYGQIAGAYYGASEIPAEWIKVLSHGAVIERFPDSIVRSPTLGKRTAPTSDRT